MRNRAKWRPVEIDAAMDSRLQNWGDWRAREESPRRTHCASIEGRYRAPRAVGDDVDSVTRSPWRPVIDDADAAFIDRVVKNPWFPEREYAFLRAHYVLRAKRELVMRTIGQRRGDYIPFLARAVIMARNRVSVVEARRAAVVDPAPHAVSLQCDCPVCSRAIKALCSAAGRALDASATTTTNHAPDNDSVVIIRQRLTPGSHGAYSAPTICCGPSGLRSESDDGGGRAEVVDAANPV
jgi:hypothetical protein